MVIRRLSRQHVCCNLIWPFQFCINNYAADIAMLTRLVSLNPRSCTIQSCLCLLSTNINITSFDLNWLNFLEQLKFGWFWNPEVVAWQSIVLHCLLFRIRLAIPEHVGSGMELKHVLVICRGHLIRLNVKVSRLRSGSDYTSCTLDPAVHTARIEGQHIWNVGPAGNG